jgi:hypothetical protein
MKTLLSLLSIVILIPSLSVYSAYHKTENFWQCENRIGGKWVFGRAPYACDASPFGDDDYVQDTYNQAIFNDENDRTAEDAEYMTGLYAIVRDASQHYLEQRKPQATNAEIMAWQRAIFTIAHQESFWSHYRQHDNTLKLMRGDYGHGHGLMQLDDRWHFVTIQQGNAWNLIGNLTHAMDEYYSGWQKAPDSDCLTDSTHWRDRSRAAYSAYNGGPSKICRWTDKDNKWKQNDIGFADKYDNRQWLNSVTDTQQNAAIDIACLMEGQESCQPTTPQSCFDQPSEDRHLCAADTEGLYAIGTMIVPQKNTNLRTTPGGTKVGQAKQGQVYQILDFSLRDTDNTLKRYYKIRHQGQDGFIYGGNQDTYSQWATPSETPATEIIIPIAGNYVQIQKEGGINLRDNIGGTKITTLPHQSILTVISTHVRTDNNRLYYEVETDQHSGFIYGGQLLPDNTLSLWTTLSALPEEPTETIFRTGRGGQMYYQKLKICPEKSCEDSGEYLIGQKLDTLCQQSGCNYRTDELSEVEMRTDWVKIRLQRNQAEGWVPSQSVEWN